MSEEARVAAMGKSHARMVDAEVEAAAPESDAGLGAHPDEAVPDEVRWFVLGVRAVMGARGMSQAEVARVLGGGAPYLSNVLKLEPGRTRRFRFHYACLLAKALNSDLIEVLTFGRDLDERLSRREEGENEP